MGRQPAMAEAGSKITILSPSEFISQQDVAYKLGYSLKRSGGLWRKDSNVEQSHQWSSSLAAKCEMSFLMGQWKVLGKMIDIRRPLAQNLR